MTPHGALLSQAHRRAQLQVGAATVAQVHQLWPLLDPKALDATFARWVNAVHTAVNARRQASAQLATGYYAALRKIEAPDADPFHAPPAGAVNSRALRVSMLVTGAISIKKAMSRGAQTDEGVTSQVFTRALDVADAQTAGEAMRYALEAGRDTITEAVARDPAAKGWQRNASPTACDFCASLAEEGFTGGEDAVSFSAHSLCSCTAEPVFG